MTATIQNTSDAKNIQFKNEFKQKHDQPNTIIIFRLNNTYKVYDEDAKVCRKICSVNIGNENSFEFGRRMLDIYLPRLVRFGYRIAIAEQQ
jgi:DNA mismatch repair protein MutS